MTSKLYVGNLSFQASQEDVEGLFAEQGQVVSVNLITDRDTGRAKGFGFVEMSSTDEANKAQTNLDGQEFMGRNLRVNPAEERKPKKDFNRRR